MTELDPPAVQPIRIDEVVGLTADLPSPLPGDPRRQAVPSIQGTVYQAWCSIDAWLRLKNADEVIYLEGAEDFDIVKSDSAITVQVKKNAVSISLGTAKAHEALENFWTLSCKDPSRQIDFHYLTTSSIAMEQDANFDGLPGIKAWRIAQTNLEIAKKIISFLSTKLKAQSALRVFLESETPDVVQERLILRFHWLTNQPELELVKRSVDDRIAAHLERQRRPMTLITNVRKYLESRFWEVVQETITSNRCLTHGELLRQFEAATTLNLSVPVDQLVDLIVNAPPGLKLLEMLLLKSPTPPDPLLQRPALTRHLEELVKQRRVILLTGSVYKGKTTLAQLVASSLCPEAWWINITERIPSEVDNLFLALARQIESRDCPNLIIIDDLDVSPKAHHGYKDSLGLVLARANTTGRGVLLTAQGASNDSAVVHDFQNIELLDVPELTIAETEALCQEHGCPEKLSETWGKFVTMWTKGHPKLIQVRIAELAARGWPNPTMIDLTTQSSALTTARQMARQLLSETVPNPTAEFVYLLSESSVPMHREVAIRLAETVEGLTNAGDVLDKLIGKWVERIEGTSFRTTALLQGVATEVWSPEKRKKAHIRLHDAIKAKQPLNPSEAAALLFHAYLGGEPKRLALTALKLQLIEDHVAKREVKRHLLWLSLVALNSGQAIADDAITAAILRSLQFQVALTLDSDYLQNICARWVEDVEKIPSPEGKSLMLVNMIFSIGFSENRKIPLNPRLKAITNLPKVPRKLLEQQEAKIGRIFSETIETDVLPTNSTLAQRMFLLATQSIRDMKSLDYLLQWLDNTATEDLRQQFEATVEWPIVQDLGAFVQGAWAAKHEETQEWEPWLALFERIIEYAKQRVAPRLGREAAKAKAIILTEYLGRPEDALTALEQAEAAFGPSVVLLEQRANVLFHRHDDETVLSIWSQMTSDPVSKASLDPFAHRRAGVCAARLKQWSQAERIFTLTADSLPPGVFDLLKFSLRVDAAFVLSLAGNQATAAGLLAEAILALPSEAAAEGNPYWEAVLRATVDVCGAIKRAYWKQDEAEPRIQPGDISSPILKVSKVAPGQAARCEKTKAQVLLLATTLGVGPSSIGHELEALKTSRYIHIRWCASEALLALSYANGSGTGFIRALVYFETAWADLSTRGESPTILELDDGPATNLVIAPERWFGLLVAGIIVSGSNLMAHLEKWLEESREKLGDDAPLTSAIQLVIEGASRPTHILEPTVINTTNAATVRCGAAAKLLSNIPVATKALKLQALLTSAFLCDASFSRQELFNLHVARHFASYWRMQAENHFQFTAPRTSVPILLHSVKEVEDGNGTLKILLQAAANALNQSLDETVMKRLF
ncbi:MAG TPA: hypothetical protein PKK23_19760 [Nitrospirales bacterium]|nr:hypothetical protein [Nitrospiraceae bacterium]HNP31292.1 hypothetical protein [Nitrospirales bacterium]